MQSVGVLFLITWHFILSAELTKTHSFFLPPAQDVKRRFLDVKTVKERRSNAVLTSRAGWFLSLSKFNQIHTNDFKNNIKFLVMHVNNLACNIIS